MNPHSLPFSRSITHLCSAAVITSVSACQTSQTPPLEIQPRKQLTPRVQSTTPILAPAKPRVKPRATPKPKPQVQLPAQLHKIKHDGIQFNIVTFDTRSQQLIVADQPNGPGSKWDDSEAAAKAHHGIAALNAGFFTPEGKPLGIVISKGKKLGANNPSSLGSGLFYHTSSGAKISRRSVWSTLSKNPPAHLLQAGPMLLENSKTISGLSSQNERSRSFLATDGRNHWCIGHASSCTLSQLSKALSTLKTSTFKPTTALNLDGGRSSDLWVSSSVKGGPTEIRPFWNKSVRNFLILKNK